MNTEHVKLTNILIAGYMEGCGLLQINLDDGSQYKMLFDKGDSQDLVVRKLKTLAEMLQQSPDNDLLQELLEQDERDKLFLAEHGFETMALLSHADEMIRSLKISNDK